MANTMAKAASWNSLMKTRSDKNFELVEPFQVSNKLEPIVSEFFDQIMDDTAASYLNFIAACESPIERLLGLALYSAGQIFSSLTDDAQYFVSAQNEIDCGGIVYRVDFLINAVVGEKHYRVVIECDGHEFHEKTKAQVEKDNIRDRNLTKAGYLIARFSGSEIVKDPKLCAREANYIFFHNRG